MNNIESEAQAQTLQLIQRIYDADQSLNADAFVQLLTPDVTFHFGSNPTLVGR